MSKIHYNLYWLRFISVISVVFIHAISISAKRFDFETHYSEYIQLLLMYATPSFVIISEFLFANRYKERPDSSFLKTRFKTLLPPYISIGLIFALMFSSGLNEFLSNSFRYIFLADQIAYFIIIILQFSVIHYLFVERLQKVKPLNLLVISFILNFGYLMFFKIVPVPIDALQYFWIKGHFMLFPAWLFYFSFGFWLGNNYGKVSKSFSKYKYHYFIGFILMMIPILFLKHFNIINTVSSKRIDILIYTAFFVLFILSFFSKKTSIPYIVEKINRYSFSIYLVHTIPLNLIAIKIIDVYWLNITFLFFISIIFAILTSYLFNKTKYGYLIVGKQMNVRK